MVATLYNMLRSTGQSKNKPFKWGFDYVATNQQAVILTTAFNSTNGW